MKDREKEILKLMYIKNEVIKHEKKQIKILREELNTLRQQKTLSKKRGRNERKTIKNN